MRPAPDPPSMDAVHTYSERRRATQNATATATTIGTAIATQGGPELWTVAGTSAESNRISPPSSQMLTRNGAALQSTEPQRALHDVSSAAGLVAVIRSSGKGTTLSLSHGLLSRSSEQEEAPAPLTRRTSSSPHDRTRYARTGRGLGQSGPGAGLPMQARSGERLWRSRSSPDAELVRDGSACATS